VSILLLGLCCQAGYAEGARSIIELKSGERLPGGFSYLGGQLTVDGRGKVAVEEVKQILFQPVTEVRPAALAGDGIEGILALASAAMRFTDRFPDAGYYLLEDLMQYTYRPNGTWNTHIRWVGRINKEEYKSLADQSFYFVEGRERVTIKKARCIHPSGAVFEADPASFKTAKAQSGPGVFLKYQQTSFRIPGVEVGSLIEMEYDQETYNPYHREFFFPYSYFQGNDPVFLSRMIVEVPKNAPFFYESLSFPAGKGEPKQEEKGEIRRYIWELRESAPIAPEPLMPKGADAIPYVHGSLFEGWDKVYDWINSYWTMNTDPHPELASVALDLVKGIDGEDQKVARLYHWVQKNIRYVIIKGDAATIYGSYPAHETVQRQFGCCVDKAMVMTAMLNAVGIKSGPLLINVMGQEMSRRIPHLRISHSINRITREDGSNYYLDATNYDFRFPSFPTVNQGRLCLDPFRRTMDFIPLPEPEANMSHKIATLTLKTDGSIEVQAEKRLTGESEFLHRATFKSMKPTERSEMMLSAINSFGQGAKLLKFDLSNLEDVEKPLGMRFEYSLSSYPRRVADLTVFRIPGMLDGLAFPEAALASRTFPIEYESTAAHLEEGTLFLPPTMKLRSVPDTVRIKNPFFEFEGRYERVGETGLKYRASFRRIDKKVPLAAYEMYKADVERIQQFARQRVFAVGDLNKGDQP
jgi:transglutaminase-like putative cysteine protease